MERYKVVLTNTAAQALRAIEGRARKQIINKLHDLEDSPEQRGAALLGELEGYRSIRAAGQRYRIIYSVENSKVIVLVLHVGIRKEGDKDDVYRIAKRLLRAGLIDRR